MAHGKKHKMRRARPNEAGKICRRLLRDRRCIICGRQAVDGMQLSWHDLLQPHMFSPHDRIINGMGVKVWIHNIDRRSRWPKGTISCHDWWHKTTRQLCRLILKQCQDQELACQKMLLILADCKDGRDILADTKVGRYRQSVLRQAFEKYGGRMPAPPASQSTFHDTIQIPSVAAGNIVMVSAA